MSCCCEKVHRLCDVTVCDGEDLVLPIPIPADGVYVLELDFLGSSIKIAATLSLGNNATFPKAPLNERYTYVGHVKNEVGEVVKFTINAVEYDCIEFTTKRFVDYGTTPGVSV